jgi:hypothetical protein
MLRQHAAANSVLTEFRIESGDHKAQSSLIANIQIYLHFLFVIKGLGVEAKTFMKLVFTSSAAFMYARLLPRPWRAAGSLFTNEFIAGCGNEQVLSARESAIGSRISRPAGC